MKISSLGKAAVFLVLVGLGLALTPQAEASLSFNGSSSKAVLDGYFLDGTSRSVYTLEMWIKPFALGGTIIKKTETWKEWWLNLEPDGGLTFGGSWPNIYWGSEVAKGAVTKNVWQHICVAVANGEASFYVNGNLVASQAVHDPIDFLSSACGSPSAAVSIGYSVNCTVPDSNFFSGLIYGIKVWNRTLSASDVLTIATTGALASAGGQPWNALLLNEGSGTVIDDSLTPLAGRVLTAQWSSDAPSFPPQSLTEGLIAYYPFNGNANDESGNGIDGIPGTSQLVADRFGIPNSAYFLNGVDSFITFSKTPTTANDNISMFCWVSPAKLPQFGIAITLGYADGNLPCNGYALGIGDATVGAGIGSGIVGENACVAWVDGRHAFPTTNVWHQIGFVRQNGNDYFYADGQLTAVQQVRTPSPPTAFCIGTLLGSDQMRLIFNGAIDDVRIYNRALSGSEIQALYTYESQPRPPFNIGLIAYYPFNGNANDASGLGNNGTVIGAQLATDRFGNANSAYSFNGTTDYIGVPDAPSLNPSSSISVSSWIKPVEARAGCGIVSKWGADDAAIGQWVLGEENNPTSLDPGFSAHAVSGAIQPASELRVDFATPQVDGLWHHLMMTYDGAVLTLYRDGKAVATKSGGLGTLAVYPQAVEIGRYYHGVVRDGRSYNFSGLIDDIRIYNRALSDSEVQELYDYESQPQSQPCTVPRRATGTANVVNVFVVGVTLTDAGCGYTTPPLVQVVGGGGRCCTCTATVANGIVTGITITDAGSGYTSTPSVQIASPPFTPWLEIGVSKVKVTQHMVLGKNYVLESSTDLETWSQIGVQFTAQDETVTQEFDVDVVGRYFRIRQVQ